MLFFKDYFNTVGIYVDNSNLLNTLKDLTGNRERGGTKIDYARLCSFISDSIHEVVKYDVRATVFHIYDGIRIDNEEKKNRKEIFLSSVKTRIEKNCQGIDFLVDAIPVRRGQGIKGDDVLMATDMLSDVLSRKIDFVAIVSGDGDFYSVTTILKTKYRIPVFVFFFSSRVNSRLKTISSMFIDLEGKLDKISF